MLELVGLPSPPQAVLSTSQDGDGGRVLLLVHSAAELRTREPGYVLTHVGGSYTAVVRPGDGTLGHAIRFIF